MRWHTLGEKPLACGLTLTTPRKPFDQRRFAVTVIAGQLTSNGQLDATKKSARMRFPDAFLLQRLGLNGGGRLARLTGRVI